MKLRTRIILISCLAVLMASVAVSVLLWGRTRRSYLAEAYVKAQQNTMLVLNRLWGELNQAGDDYVNDILLEYLFKAENDEYNVCFRKENGGPGKELYNRTVFDEPFLRKLKYNDRNTASESESYIPDMRLSYARLDWEGRHYLVFRETLLGDVDFYRIEDITYVWERMNRLTVFLMLITGAVLLCTMTALWLILNKMLKPLKELTDGARQIAEGHYENRITIARRDEIGQLGENFNKMAQAVELRTRSLEESELKKTLFMGNLTHELKTPMTSISGYAQTLLHANLSEEDREEALSYIFKECARLERLSRKMMKLLELDRDTELSFVKLPARKIFGAVEKSLRGSLEEKGLILEISGGEHIFCVEPDLMVDAVVNLVDNAAKASERGGKIILKAGPDFIEVQDFGKGIPKEEQERILEPFYMVDKSRSRKRGGAGLGLALVALIAKAHGLKLVIESEVGRGTVMRLVFTKCLNCDEYSM